MHDTWFQRLRVATRLIFYTGGALFFLAAGLQYLRGIPVEPLYVVTGALMVLVPSLLDWAEARAGTGEGQ